MSRYLFVVTLVLFSFFYAPTASAIPSELGVDGSTGLGSMSIYQEGVPYHVSSNESVISGHDRLETAQKDTKLDSWWSWYALCLITSAVMFVSNMLFRQKKYRVAFFVALVNAFLALLFAGYAFGTIANTPVVFLAIAALASIFSAVCARFMISATVACEKYIKTYRFSSAVCYVAVIVAILSW